MATSAKLPRRRRLMLRVTSVLPILKRAWVDLNEHIENGDLHAVHKWLTKRPYVGSKINDVPKDIRNPICTAAALGEMVIFDLLREKGFSPFTEDCKQPGIDTKPRCRSIHLASNGGHLELVKKLLEEYDEQVNDYGGGNTPLQWAILGKHVDIVMYLLDKGADPNIADQMEHEIQHMMHGCDDYHYWCNECYPLGKAFNRGLVDIAEKLILAGASIETVRLSGTTLMDTFIEKEGLGEIVKMLFERRCYTTVRDLFQYVHCEPFNSSGMLAIWKFLFRLDVRLDHLKKVPSDYKSIYESSEVWSEVLDVISNSSVFSENATLAEIMLKIQNGQEDMTNSFDMMCDKHVKTSTYSVLKLKDLCCLKIRKCTDCVHSKIEYLPITLNLKQYIRLDHLPCVNKSQG